MPVSVTAMRTPVPACRATYLTALTGWGSEADQERARAAGFDAHLTKPASVAQIGHLLASLGASCPAHP